MLVPILNIQAVKCNTSVKALLQCYIKFCRLTIDVQSCVLLLSVAANKPAHEQHSANLIKLWQHTILSADRAAVFWTLLNRENGGGDGQRLNPTVSTCCRSLLSCKQIPVSEERREFFVAHVLVPEAVSSWSWVGCVVECGSAIVERLGWEIDGNLMMTLGQVTVCWNNLFYVALLHYGC